MVSLLYRFQSFGALVKDVCAESPMHKKRLDSFLLSRDEKFWESAEDFSNRYMKYLKARNLPVSYAVKAYLRMCNDFVVEQFKFMKTGEYSCKSSYDAIQKVYNNEEVMRSYMHGLLLSQFLWKNHYLMYRFLTDELDGRSEVRKVLEVGAGHGLFLSEALKRFPEAMFQVVDISPVSIEITREILKFFAGDGTKVNFTQADIREYDTAETFDLIMMGEVLEHVENPRSILESIREFLTPSGGLFITTCVNCPAIDHIYNFDSVEAIGDMILETGYVIMKEIHLMVDEDAPKEKSKEMKAGINYAAFVSRV